MIKPQFILPLSRELVIDLFAGGGGASTGIEQALGRHVDIAVNHDPEAVSLHQANHPQTKHFVSDVFEVDPVAVCEDQPIGLLWASPDCKHFSKAKGGKPVSKKIRGLAWVIVKWAKLKRPRKIIVENVEEFQTWGPVLAGGRVCPERKGRTFRTWKRSFERMGATVEHRELRACDYDTPTIRKRLFVVISFDDAPIVWPQKTNGPGLKPYRTAAECIDWSIPCPSIFERQKPLVDATLRRIAHGLKRFVIDAATPFIVPVTHQGDSRVHSIDEPVRTITSAERGELALSVPTLIQTGYGERPGQAPRVPGLEKPLGTAVDGQKHALVAAFLAKHFGGNATPGWPLDKPISTVTTVDHHAMVTSNLVKLRGTSNSAASDEPLATVSAGGTHHAEVRALLIKYYGQQQDPRLDEPMHTVTTKDRFGLVTIKGELYEIADIGMRMLQPRELYTAQGFHASVGIEPPRSGRLE